MSYLWYKYSDYMQFLILSPPSLANSHTYQIYIVDCEMSDLCLNSNDTEGKHQNFHRPTQSIFLTSFWPNRLLSSKLFALLQPWFLAFLGIFWAGFTLRTLRLIVILIVLLLGCGLSLRVLHAGNMVLWVAMWRALETLGSGHYWQVIRSFMSMPSGKA